MNTQKAQHIDCASSVIYRTKKPMISHGIGDRENLYAALFFLGDQELFLKIILFTFGGASRPGKGSYRFQACFALHHLQKLLLASVQGVDVGKINVTGKIALKFIA